MTWVKPEKSTRLNVVESVVSGFFLLEALKV